MVEQIYGRFQQKHDIEENWLKAKNFAPLIGEIIIYDADYDEEQNPNGYRYPRIKVGIWDGISEKTDDMLVSNLPFEGGYTNEEINALLKNLNSENITVKQTELGTTTIGPGTLDLLDSKNTTVFSIDSEARVEGGITDKDMVTEMVGALGSLTNLTPAVANESMSLAFGANNNTYAPGTVSFGVNVSAGTKAYYYDAITFGDKPTIQLATTRRSSTYKAPSYPSSVTWEKGDRVTIKTKNYNHVCAGVIESVSGNTITLSAALPFTEIDYTAILGAYVYTVPHDRTIVNIDKPEAGVLSLGFGAIAMGGGASGKTKAVGMLSTALGYETEALGSFALSAGKNTKAAYASIALGAGAEAMGETSVAFGTNTKATGAYSMAFGKDCEATAGGAVAVGVDTHATAWTAYAEGSSSTASGQASHAEGNITQATAHSTHAEGNITQATANSAHAEGNSTVASGISSHAEGNYSVASGQASHAEGGGENADVATTASGNYAHAEGYRVKAEGNHSHAEGAITQTIGSSSHAEGEGSIAKGSHSHAEGYYTVATCADQHVQGRHTIEDTAQKYAHIIGNGTSSAKANIHTVDWSGNAWYKGDVTADGISLKGTYNSIVLKGTNTEGAKGLGASQTASHGAALGWKCKVTGGHGMAIGACVTANAGQVALGKANDPAKSYKNANNENNPAIFMVGNGNTDTAGNVITPFNAFAVLADGTGYLGNKKIVTEDYKFTTIKIGETELTEEQIKKIINFIDSIGFKGGNV